MLWPRAIGVRLRPWHRRRTHWYTTVGAEYPIANRSFGNSNWRLKNIWCNSRGTRRYLYYFWESFGDRRFWYSFLGCHWGTFAGIEVAPVELLCIKSVQLSPRWVMIGGMIGTFQKQCSPLKSRNDDGEFELSWSICVALAAGRELLVGCKLDSDVVSYMEKGEITYWLHDCYLL